MITQFNMPPYSYVVNYWSNHSLVNTGVFIAFSLFSIYYFFIPRSSIRHLRGPPSQSWVLGNIRQLETKPVGDCEFQWTEHYGHSYRLKGGYGEDILSTSDPKVLQYLFQTSSYNTIRPPSFIEQLSNLIGRNNILTTEGDVHKRHRKAMLPAFGFPETKALAHVFHSKATRLMDQWKIAMKDGISFETNVHRWIARATLDAIGEAAFSYQFGTMDNRESKLGRAYQDMLLFVNAYPSYIKIAWNNLAALVPHSIVWVTNVPTKTKKMAEEMRDTARELAEKLLDEEWKLYNPVNGNGKRDVMSLLVKANSTVDERKKLTRQEVIEQMSAIMLAGHETTANTLTWSLWELAKNHDVQNKLREEILKYSETYPGDNIPVTEFDGMRYTVAFIKEILRFHPIAPRFIRVIAKDMVVPLHYPIQDKNGNVVHEVLLKKGTRVFAPIHVYNRNAELWGPDPHVFHPERWFDMKECQVKFGVYGNLGTFGAGIHACIGWRFAVYEIQAFLIAMMKNFEYKLPDNAPGIRRTFAVVMVPQEEGKEDTVSMPLKICALKN